jgi:predicted secreted Zn-dependent protease
VRAPVLLLASVTLLTASAAPASGVSGKPAVRVSKATGPISRLTATRITVAKLTCTRPKWSPSLRGLRLGAAVSISCRNGALVGITRLSPPKDATPSSTSTMVVVPAAAPAPAVATTCPDTYQGPVSLPLTPAQTGLAQAVDPPHVYPVTGDSAAELNASMARCRPAIARPYNAITRYTLGYQYTSVKKASGLCEVTKIAVSLRVGVVLPSWTPGPGAAPGLAEQWQTYIAALTLHEEGHVDRYVEGAENVLAQLEALPELDCGTVASRVAATVQDASLGIARDQADYDAETSHGRTQGAVLVS